MHCPECKCTYGSWTACPICKIPLVENVPPDSGPESDPISYEALVEQVRTAGGQLTVELSATDVGVRQADVGVPIPWLRVCVGQEDARGPQQPLG